MIAVLDNQMISVPMIILGEVLYGSVDLGAGPMSCTHTHRASEDKARAAFGFYLEDSAGGVFMSSKAIFHAMHCEIQIVRSVRWCIPAICKQFRHEQEKKTRHTMTGCAQVL